MLSDNGMYSPGVGAGQVAQKLPKLRGRAPQIRDAPQSPGSPPANLVLLVGRQNRQITRDKRQQTSRRLDLGAELTGEFRSKIGRKLRVFDMTVKRKRAQRAGTTPSIRVRCIVVRHIDRQGVAPAETAQIEPRDGVKACAVRGLR